jgi:hypothetical protein
VWIGFRKGLPPGKLENLGRSIGLGVRECGINGQAGSKYTTEPNFRSGFQHSILCRQARSTLSRPTVTPWIVVWVQVLEKLAASLNLGTQIGLAEMKLNLNKAIKEITFDT